MSVKRILLKNSAGTPVACATIHREKSTTRISLPDEMTLLALSVGGRVLDVQDDLSLLPEGALPLSLLVKRGEDTLFASESRDVLLEKWRLVTAVEEREKAKSVARENDTGSSDISEETEFLPTADPLPDEASTEDFPPTLEEPPENALETLMQKGEPFPLFEEMIEGSRWVKLPENAALLGHLPADDVLLYGIPGKLGDAPNDEEWTFLPTSPSGTRSSPDTLRPSI